MALQLAKDNGCKHEVDFSGEIQILLSNGDLIDAGGFIDTMKDILDCHYTSLMDTEEGRKEVLEKAKALVRKLEEAHD